MAKKPKGKKKKKDKDSKKSKKKIEKTESQIFLEELTATVAAKLKAEKWDLEDAERKNQKPKKKMSKKEKMKLQAKRNEELKLAVEQEKLRLQEEEKVRLEEERKRALEKDSKDAAEQAIRIEQLRHSCANIRKFQQQWLKKEKQDYLESEWQQYLKCDGLPDPCNIAEMNTYLHLWDKVKENTLSDLALQKTDEVLELLATLDNFLDCPAVSDSKKCDWLHIRNLFRDYQQFNLDCLAYRLLRDINTHLERLDIPTARKVVMHPQEMFVLVVWALVQIPIPLPNPKKVVKPIDMLEFPELYNLEVSFPKSIDIWAKCVRAMVCKYDHLSHKSATYNAPNVTEEKMYLDKITALEYEEKVKIKAEIRKQIKGERLAEIKRLRTVAMQSEKGEDIDAARKAEKGLNEFIKVDSSQIYLLQEDEICTEIRQRLVVEVPENVINLRKYRILGGVFFIDLYFQPPQPTEMVLSDLTLSTLTLPKASESVPFHFKFHPRHTGESGEGSEGPERLSLLPPSASISPHKPSTSDPEKSSSSFIRTPEEIEAEMKYIEEQYEHMISVSLSLPDWVLWMDPPAVVQWDDEELFWTTADVYDVKYNEEKQTLQFKLGKFAPFSFAVLRYSCMPYQAWELKPILGGKVTLTITAPILILEFTISGSSICLSSLQNAPSKALDHLLNVWTSLPKLRRQMRRAGLDVFPAVDASIYLDAGAVCDKMPALETHIYYQMAQASVLYNFQWSRWNFQAGRRGVVMQLREYAVQERGKQPNFQMCYITPLKAAIVDCSEVSSAFSEEPIKKMRFYSDLMHLLLGMGPHTLKCKLQKVPTDLINTVAQLLITTRIFSMC